MAVICKPKKRKELDDIILQGKIEVDKSKPKNDMDDTDARLIDALGNLDKVVFFDKDGKTVSITPDTPLDGYRFSM